MKKIIILQHGGGELANQLWNFISIYAYCQKKGVDCQNYSFFEYGQYFNITIKNKVINLFFFRSFQNYHKRRGSFKTKFWRFVYKIYAKIIVFLFKNQVISSINTGNKKYYLPPTEENSSLTKLENNNDTLYFTGWLFRNPAGIETYKKEIVDYFRPKEKYTLYAEKSIAEVKNKYKNIVGVHIRQNDYQTYKSGEYFVSQERIREILNEYLANYKKTPKETLFIITSDGHIEEKIFNGLKIKINNGNSIEDMYTLSLCDVIIGSNSSFGNFAAYYGDKPYIIFQKEKMDWDYYKNKSNYFKNKYSVMNYFSSIK